MLRAYGSTLYPNLSHPVNVGKVAWLLSLNANYIQDLVSGAGAAIPPKWSQGGPQRPGALGQAWSPSSTSAMLSLSHLLDNLSTSGRNFSVAAWVYPADTTTGIIAAKGTITNSPTSNTTGWCMQLTSGQRAILREGFTGNDKALASPATQVPLRTWTRLLFTSAGNFALYMNGINISLAVWDSNSGSLQQENSSNLLIGGGNNNLNIFNGFLDDVCIWNYTLNPKQAQLEFQESSRGYTRALNRKSLVLPSPPIINQAIVDTISFSQSIPVLIDDRRTEKRRFLYEPRGKRSHTDTLALTHSIAVELDLSITKIDSITFQSSLPILIKDRRLELRRFVFVRQRTDHPTTDTINFVSTPSYVGIFNFSPVDTLSLSENIGGNVFSESVTQSLGLYDRSTLRKVTGQVIKRLELDRAELGSEVNWQDPITNGLLFCALLNERAGPAHNVAFNNFRGPDNSIWEAIGYRDAQAWAEDARLNVSGGVTLLAQTFWNGAVSTINIAKKAPDTGATGGYALRMNGIQPRFGVFSGGFLTAIDGPSIAKGSYTLAGTYDNNRISIYLNGRQAATSVVGASKMAAPTGFGTLIGDAAFKLNCTLVMIWNRALSRAELADIGVSPLRLIRKPTKKRVVVSEEIYSDTLDVTNQLTFSQSVSQGYVFSKSPVDTLAITDAASVLNLHRYVVDAVAFTDVLYPGSIWRRAVADALSLSDYAIDNLHYYFSSSISFSEVVKRGGVNYRAVLQKLIVTQDISTPLWAVAHEVNFEERLTTAKVINVVVSDTMSLRDDPPIESPESVADTVSLDQSVYLDVSEVEPKLADEIAFTSTISVGRVSSYSVLQTIGLGSYVSFYTPVVRVP